MLESKVSRRLKEPTAAEVCDLIYAPRLAGFADGFGYLGDVNKAHIVMLAECGLIDAPVAVALARGVLEMEQVGPQAVTLDPLREDAYFNYEAHLIEKVGTDVGGRLHIGRSRNDLLATLDRLRGRDVLMDLLDALYNVRQSALDAAAKYTDAIMPGYTHLQPAQPITFGFYLSGVAQALERDCLRLAATLDSMNRSPMGAAAFAGTPFAINRARTAELLGFDGFLENTLDAVGSRDFALESMAQMTLLAVFWSRVAQDFFVWSTHEFALIDFPDSVAGTSSIMPQKKNPVVLEYLKGRTGQILGSLVASAATIKGTNFTHTGDGNRESMRGFWESAQECQQCLTLLDLVLRTARPNLETGLRKAAEDFSTATGLADLMVSAADLSFREAHHVVGAVVRQAHTDSISRDIHTMTSSIHEVAQRSRQASDEAGSASRQAITARKNIGNLSSSISDLGDSVMGSVRAMQQLEEETQEVGSVLTVIRSIAEQTNLLALNAAIEAARAGEQGRGFAVVADEVRNLAQKTAASTAEIQQIIQRLQNSANTVLDVMTVNGDKSRESIEHSIEATRLLEAIAQTVSQIDELNADIAHHTQQQIGLSESIQKETEVLQQDAQATANGAEATARLGEQLVGTGDHLRQATAQFRV